MSTYGATGSVLPVPPPPPPPPPPAHEAPLILQLAGLPEPAMMKPKLVEAPAARLPLYSRLVAVTCVPDWLASASQ
jgi:hypothetical protein